MEKGNNIFNIHSFDLFIRGAVPLSEFEGFFPAPKVFMDLKERRSEINASIFCILNTCTIILQRLSRRRILVSDEILQTLGICSYSTRLWV